MKIHKSEIIKHILENLLGEKPFKMANEAIEVAIKELKISVIDDKIELKDASKIAEFLKTYDFGDKKIQKHKENGGG